MRRLQRHLHRNVLNLFGGKADRSQVAGEDPAKQDQAFFLANPTTTDSLHGGMQFILWTTTTLCCATHSHFSRNMFKCNAWFCFLKSSFRFLAIFLQPTVCLNFVCYSSILTCTVTKQIDHAVDPNFFATSTWQVKTRASESSVQIKDGLFYLFLVPSTTKWGDAVFVSDQQPFP